MFYTEPSSKFTQMNQKYFIFAAKIDTKKECTHVYVNYNNIIL